MFYARTNNRPKQRRSQLKMFPAPIAGWISNRALATPYGEHGVAQQGAEVLDNLFCRSTSVVLRRGKLKYCTLGDGSLPALSLFSYNNGSNRKFFGATESTIYDITDVQFADDSEIVDEDGALIITETGDWFGWSSTQFLDVMAGFTWGNWITVQFATSGGVYLVGVNGVDEGFIYDGAYFYPWVAGGISALNYDAEVTPFTTGTVTGGTSGATGVITRVIDNGATGTLHLKSLTGTFIDNEPLTGGGGAATANGIASIVAPGITFTGADTGDMSYVWVYKNRLWFAQSGSMDAWYLPIDSIGGAATKFPLAGVFGIGGTLMFGQSWSLSTSGDGGLSEQCAFVSSEGEVAVYQGLSPTDSATWSKVGTYRIGKPLGNRAFVKGGGDLAIATSIGLVPLSKAVELDITALSIASISNPIADAWTQAVNARGLQDWQGHVWPELKIAVFAPPDIVGAPNPVMFIANTETGAWSRFTNWHGLCLEVFEGKLYFGSPEGKVFLANATGLDDGEPYTGAVLPLFDDLGSPASTKIPKVGRVVSKASAKINDAVDWQGDFNLELPPPPDATSIPDSPVWGAAEWGSSVWASSLPEVINDDWRSLSGLGYTGSLAFQVTSGSLQPLDVDVIRFEMVYDTAEMIS